VKNGKNLKDQVIFMTGATSGLGRMAAIKAAANGATVIALARTIEKGKELILFYREKYPEGKGKIEIIEGNLNAFRSVQKACLEIQSKYPKIDCLVLNAATLNFKPVITEDQIEETLQVNVLSPLLFIFLLTECLNASDQAKIIFTSSGLHQGHIRFDDIEFKQDFESFKVYRQSKLAIILICRYFAQHYKEQNIDIYTFTPGLVFSGIVRNFYLFPRKMYRLIAKSPAGGAKTLIWLMKTPRESLRTGAYYKNKRIKKTSEYSNDVNAAEQLWKLSTEYLGPYLDHSPLVTK
jgi:NAD(P)-dependent dehydrogenase (short-subunit alcohol dehydrogenase family)